MALASSRKLGRLVQDKDSTCLQLPDGLQRQPVLINVPQEDWSPSLLTWKNGDGSRGSPWPRVQARPWVSTVCGSQTPAGCRLFAGTGPGLRPERSLMPCQQGERKKGAQGARAAPGKGTSKIQEGNCHWTPQRGEIQGCFGQPAFSAVRLKGTGDAARQRLSPPPGPHRPRVV